MEIERIQEMGIAVKDIEVATKLYTTILGAIPSELMPVDAYGNLWRMCRIGHVDLRLMEANEQNEIARLVSKRGDCLYHVGLKVSNIKEAISWMKQNHIEMIDEIPRSEDDVKFAFASPDSFRGVRFKLIEGEPALKFRTDLPDANIPKSAMVDRICHIGINTLDLEASISHYKQVLGTFPFPIYNLDRYGMKSNFNRLGDIDFEFLSPATEDGVVARSITKIGEGQNHICFEVSNICATLAWMMHNNLRLIDEQPLYTGQNWFAFVHPKAFNGVMFELIQENPQM